MKLSVLERVLLGGMLADYRGSFTNLKIVRVGREALSFTEDELAKLKIVQKDDNVTWNPEASLEFQDVEILVSETMTNVIKGMLEKLNKEEKLTDQHFSLYEKFII